MWVFLIFNAIVITGVLLDELNAFSGLILWRIDKWAWLFSADFFIKDPLMGCLNLVIGFMVRILFHFAPFLFCGFIMLKFCYFGLDFEYNCLFSNGNLVSFVYCLNMRFISEVLWELMMIFTINANWTPAFQSSCGLEKWNKKLWKIIC